MGKEGKDGALVGVKRVEGRKQTSPSRCEGDAGKAKRSTQGMRGRREAYGVRATTAPVGPWYSKINLLSSVRPISARYGDRM